LAGPEPKTVLILGGTAEAMALAEALADRLEMRVITSLAGRTRVPTRPPGELRIGGFSGADGLARYLGETAVDALVDATHPFATRISANARTACRRTGVPMLSIARPGWTREPGDTWVEVADEPAAAAALPKGARVLLALGSQRLQAFTPCEDIAFFVRMVDEPAEPLPLATCRVIVGRPSRSVTAEQALMEDNRIDHLVCRNSGGEASYAKIAAARALALPVIMIDRPKPDGTPAVATVAEAVRRLAVVLDGDRSL
jgi:precorrin-6A/cobalt-precorrin-6A reductase